LPVDFTARPQQGGEGNDDKDREIDPQCFYTINVSPSFGRWTGTMALVALNGFITYFMGYDLPLNFHPAAVRVSTKVAPVGAM
jgi:hypothetical protein